jgi:site-specific recombinase XerD
MLDSRARPSPPTNKGQKFVPEPLTPEEVRTLLAACSNRSPSGIRLRAMIAVMYGAGLRVSETLALHPRDIDTADQFIRIRSGKGSKFRTVGINSYCCALLDRWLDLRPQLGLTARHPIFAQYTKGRVGTPLNSRYVRAALARTGAKAGLTKRVHPHGLRHSLATRMARQGESVAVIQAQLGHEWITTTARYIQRLGAGETVAAMRRVDLWGEED